MMYRNLPYSSSMTTLKDKHRHVLLCVVISFGEETAGVPALRTQSSSEIQTTAHDKPCTARQQYILDQGEDKSEGKSWMPHQSKPMT